jgi:hypothetical protein
MQCPKKAAQHQSGPSAPAKQNVSQPGAGNHVQTCYNQGRLNHLDTEVVQETPGMIVGMFPVDSHIAEVLFDTGATHSFITASWVEAHNLPITTMSAPIQIDLVDGKVRADSVCLNISVEIWGIEFPANLIVMGTQGIDVILGINWLDKYWAVISCDKRTIKLMSPLGEEVVTELVPPEPRKGSCHQMAIDSCRRFDPGGSLDRRVNCRRVSQPRWVGARRSAKGGRREGEKGKTRSLRVVVRPGRVRLQ